MELQGIHWLSPNGLVKIKESLKPRRRESDTVEEEPVNDFEDIELHELEDDE